MSGDTAATGIEPVHVTAQRAGITGRCMLRRLKALAARIAAEHPHEAPLLVLFALPTSRGVWHLDRSVAYRHARGLVAERTQAPWEEALTLLREVATDVGYVRTVVAP